MKESTKAQHEVDKANLAAAKAEAKANWEEAKRYFLKPLWYKNRQRRLTLPIFY